jgi:hypothetical protein
MAEDSSIPGLDPFMKFWSDFMGKMAASGMPSFQASPDFMSQMRRTFFDAMAQQADEFLRSEAFLSAMKHSMETSLAWQQAVNQFLQKGLAAAQMPSKVDSDHLVSLVRGMEERVLERMDELARRIDRLETAARPKAAKA